MIKGARKNKRTIRERRNQKKKRKMYSNKKKANGYTMSDIKTLERKKTI